MCNLLQTLKASAHLFPQLKKLLKLTPVQEVVFGLALEHSANPELQKLAGQFVKQKLPELVAAYVDADSSRQHDGGLHDTSPEVATIPPRMFYENCLGKVRQGLLYK